MNLGVTRILGYLGWRLTSGTIRLRFVVGSLGILKTLVPSVFVLRVLQALLRPTVLLALSRWTFVGVALLRGRPLFVLLIAFVAGLGVCILLRCLQAELLLMHIRHERKDFTE